MDGGGEGGSGDLEARLPLHPSLAKLLCRDAYGSLAMEGIEMQVRTVWVLSVKKAVCHECGQP